MALCRGEPPGGTARAPSTVIKVIIDTMLRLKILFICLGNSCRSIMAEALTRHLCGDRWEVSSAGLNPLGWVAPETLRVLLELGVNTVGLRSKGLNEFNLADYRVLVNLSARCLKGVIPGSAPVIQRPVTDPFGGSLADYRQSCDAIRQIILREFCPEH
jgi:arsenate reductase (thioredoxin)